MGKTTGLGDRLYVGGYDLSGDIGSLSGIRGGFKPIDITDITQSGHERTGGVRDGEIEFVSWFDPATAHPVLSTLPTTDRIVTYGRGALLGNAAACIVAKQIDYNGKRSNSGEFPLTVQAQANGYGLEWGVQLTDGVRTDTGATNGTGFDLVDVSTAFGLQAYLHVTAFSGTDATIKIQDSTTLGGVYTDITGAAFTSVTTAPRTQRIATATNATVRQFLRVVTTTTGGFSSLAFQVTVVRNTLVPVF